MDDHLGKDLKLCTVALLSCMPILSIAQHISEHVPPCRRTTPLYARAVFAMGQFSVAPAEIRDSNIVVYCSMMASFGLHSLWVHPKYTWTRNDAGPPIACDLRAPHRLIHPFQVHPGSDHISTRLDTAPSASRRHLFNARYHGRLRSN